MIPTLRALRPHLIALVAGLAVLIAWEAIGADLAVGRLFGTPAGFPLRESFWTARVLHEGGRWLAGLALVLLLVDAVRTHDRGPSRRERLAWLGVVLLSLLVVPAIKHFSKTSCPWDLAEFGGTATYVPHWLLGVADGGSGRCFPSGHAVSAFGFFGIHFLWRGHDDRRALAALLAVLVLGALFGAAQVMRGAHHVSHVLWSAWLCWAIACAAAAVQSVRRNASPLSRRKSLSVADPG